MNARACRSYIGLLLLFAGGAALAAGLPARLDWARPVVMSTPVSGVIAGVMVQPGQPVRQGDLLVELDQRLFGAALKRARADEKKARYALDEAVREFERTQELYDRTLLSEHDRQMAEIAMVSAESEHASAEAAVTEAQVRLEYSRVRAPFDARVLRVEAAVGETLVSRLQAQPLVTLARNGRMRAVADLAADQIGALSLGAPVRVMAAGVEYPATIGAVASEADASGTYRVDAVFDVAADSALRPGQSVELILEP